MKIQLLKHSLLCPLAFSFAMSPSAFAATSWNTGSPPTVMKRNQFSLSEGEYVLYSEVSSEPYSFNGKSYSAVTVSILNSKTGQIREVIEIVLTETLKDEKRAADIIDLEKQLEKRGIHIKDPYTGAPSLSIPYFLRESLKNGTSIEKKAALVELLKMSEQWELNRQANQAVEARGPEIISQRILAISEIKSNSEIRQLLKGSNGFLPIRQNLEARELGTSAGFNFEILLHYFNKNHLNGNYGKRIIPGNLPSLMIDGNFGYSLIPINRAIYEIALENYRDASRELFVKMLRQLGMKASDLTSPENLQAKFDSQMKVIFTDTAKGKKLTKQQIEFLNTAYQMNLLVNLGSEPSVDYNAQERTAKFVTVESFLRSMKREFEKSVKVSRLSKKAFIGMSCAKAGR